MLTGLSRICGYCGCRSIRRRSHFRHVATHFTARICECGFRSKLARNVKAHQREKEMGTGHIHITEVSYDRVDEFLLNTEANRPQLRQLSANLERTDVDKVQRAGLEAEVKRLRKLRNNASKQLQIKKRALKTLVAK